MSPPRMNFHSPNGTSTHPMHAMYSSPKLHAFGAIDQNPKAKELAPMWGRPVAFSWAGRTAHPDLTPTTIKLDRAGRPIYLEAGIGALRYDNEGTGFAINQTYKDDDNEGVRAPIASPLSSPILGSFSGLADRVSRLSQTADMNDHIGGGFSRALNGTLDASKIMR